MNISRVPGPPGYNTPCQALGLRPVFTAVSQKFACKGSNNLGIRNKEWKKIRTRTISWMPVTIPAKLPHQDALSVRHNEDRGVRTPDFSPPRTRIALPPPPKPGARAAVWRKCQDIYKERRSTGPKLNASGGPDDGTPKARSRGRCIRRSRRWDTESENRGEMHRVVQTMGHRKQEAGGNASGGPGNRTPGREAWGKTSTRNLRSRVMCL